MILNALKTIGRGFLFGVGFGVALCVIFEAMSIFFFDREMSKEKSARLTRLENPTATDIVVADVEEQKREGTTAIIGSIKNNGATSRSRVELRANLFNHGKFVDQYSTYVSGTIEPGASAYFKISCGCGSSQPAEHDSFKVEVVNGY